MKEYLKKMKTTYPAKDIFKLTSHFNRLLCESLTEDNHEFNFGRENCRKVLVIRFLGEFQNVNFTKTKKLFTLTKHLV